MLGSKFYKRSTILFIVFWIIECHELYKLNHNQKICPLLESKHTAVYSWIEYPLVYEPIARGRLTVWAGISTVPTSDFGCAQDSNLPKHITLSFENFVDKYEWTYYDANKGSTLSGISVYHREDVDFNIAIDYKQAQSCKDCNEIELIELISDNSTKDHFGTICHDCSLNIMKLVEGQLEELIKNSFNNQLIDNMYWHLTQMVSNQHFSGYLSLDDDLD